MSRPPGVRVPRSQNYQELSQNNLEQEQPMESPASFLLTEGITSRLLTVLRGSVAEGEPEVTAVGVLDGNGHLAGWKRKFRHLYHRGLAQTVPVHRSLPVPLHHFRAVVGKGGIPSVVFPKAPTCLVRL